MSAPPERRRALTFLGADVIACMLDLPESVYVVGVHDDFLRNGVRVMVEGGDFAPVPPECEPPSLPTPGLRRFTASADRAARDADLLAGGPDYGEIEIMCPMVDCPWSSGFDTAEPGAGVTLGDLFDAMSAHIEAQHP